MAAPKIDQHMRMILAIMQARLAALKQENSILMKDMGQFIKDNREYVCQQNPNMQMMEINPYASIYVNSALKAVEIPGVELFKHSDGATVIAVPKEHSAKLNELKIQIDKLAKEFCTDRKTFESHMKENDSVLTIPQDALSDSQFFMFTSELTNAGAFYYVDAEKQTISYLASQQKQVTQAVYACAAEMSSKDANYYTHYFNKTGALYDRIGELGDKLKNDECMYLVSEDRITEDGIFALRIENNSYTEIYKNADGMIKEGKLHNIDYDKENDVALLCLQTFKYNKPLLISQDDFEYRSLDKNKASIQTETFKSYGALIRNENDRLVVNFLRNANKNGINIETFKKDVSEIYESIKDQCLNSDDTKKISAWENIMNIPAEEVQETIAGYKSVTYALKTAVIDKAEVEKEKTINKDRE